MLRRRVFVSVRSAFVLACAALFVPVCNGPVLADVRTPVRPLAGAVIVTRTSAAEAGLMWDATQYVTQLVNEKITDEPGMRAIEATALRALADKGKSLTASTLTLKVTYARTGAVSPVYKSATFEGFEQVVTIDVARTALARNAGVWSEQLANGKVPKGVRVTVTGKLPPVQ